MIAGRSYVSPAVHTSPVQDSMPISDAITQALNTKLVSNVHTLITLPGAA